MRQSLNGTPAGRLPMGAAHERQDGLAPGGAARAADAGLAARVRPARRSGEVDSENLEPAGPAAAAGTAALQCDNQRINNQRNITIDRLDHGELNGAGAVVAAR